MKIKYINNKEVQGIEYDWQHIYKEYRKLKVPKGLYDPTTCPIERNAYNILMSIRSTGKTTAWLLIGMLMNRDYGTQIIYMRQVEDMTMPKFSREALKVIIEYDNGIYIRKCTNDRYNSVYVHARRSYFCLRDEDGRVVERAEEPFMIAVSIDKAEYYKSSFNVPKGDLVIFDEFISSMYRPNEFVDMEQLLSTIIRSRRSVRVVMTANNTNVHSMYFKELQVSKEVRDLKEGDYKQITTPKGTPIYVELIGAKPSFARAEVNRFYFGFDNPQLASIQGGVAWAFNSVPHIVNDPSDRVLYRGLRIMVNDVMLQAELVLTEDRGLIANVHECTRSDYADVVILTLDDIKDKRELWGFGRGKLCVMFWDLYKSNKLYYDCNETGSLIADYVRQCKLLRR